MFLEPGGQSSSAANMLAHRSGCGGVRGAQRHRVDLAGGVLRMASITTFSIGRVEAAGAIVDGLRRRKPRVLRPRRWAGVSRLRELLAPSLDSQLARNDAVQDILGRLDAREGEALLTSWVRTGR